MFGIFGYEPSNRENIYLELSNEKHHKLYELTLENKTVKATYGRIGYTVNTKIYNFDKIIEARLFLEKKIQIKPIRVMNYL